jgi:hypothetical protein
MWSALLAFTIFGPLVIGRGPLDRYPVKLLAIVVITILLTVFCVNWWVVEPCSPL